MGFSELALGALLMMILSGDPQAVSPTQREVAKHIQTRQKSKREMQTFVGPNDKGLVLNAVGILPSLRGVNDDEFTFYVKSPLCQPVELGAAKFGDIGLISDGSSAGRNLPTIHAFVFLSTDLAYEKRGPHVHTMAQVGSLHKVWRDFAVREKGHKVDYFRCQSLREKIESLATGQEFLAKAFFEEETLEKYVSEFIFGHRTISYIRFYEMVERLQVSVDSIEAQEMNLSSEQRMLAEVLVRRVRGLADQLLQIKGDRFVGPLEKVASRIEMLID